jgi:hypothetical protein
MALSSRPVGWDVTIYHPHLDPMRVDPLGGALLGLRTK